MMRVALFGGAFDPPHVGHALGAVFARTCLNADEVWLLPSAGHPFHKKMVPFEHRVAMCTALCGQLGPWLRVNTVEATIEGAAYTVDVLKRLRTQHPENQFVLVVGSDIVADLPKWKAWPEIEAMAEVAVLNRAGFPSDRSVGPPMAEVSSTDVRARLQDGRGVQGLVPDVVETYLRTHGLYGAAAR